MPPLMASRSFYLSPLDTLIARPQLTTRAGATWSIPGDTSRINSLPAEVLMRTFLLALDTATNHTNRVQMMLFLTWVCRKWRELMIFCPMVWATLTGTEKPEVLEAFLERSKQAPITIVRDIVRIDGDRKHVQPFLIGNATRIFRHLNRIKSFDSYLYFDDRDNIECLLAHQAPSLEFLRLAFGGNKDWQESVPVLSEILFCGQRPRKLKHIELTKCALEWNSPLLSGVTTLVLNSQKRPDFERFTSALAHMEALESFTITRMGLPTLTRNRTLSDYTIDAVELPNLREVTFNDDLEACTLFLRTVDCNLSKIMINSENQDLSSSLYRSFYNVCTVRLRKHLHEFPLRECEVRTGVAPGTVTPAIGTLGYTTARDISTAKLDREPVLSLFLLLPNAAAPDVENILTVGFEHLPLYPVITLDLALGYRCSLQFWLTTLPLSVPWIWNLFLSSSAPREFFVSYYLKHVAPNAGEITLREFPFAQLAAVRAVGTIPSDLQYMVDGVIAHRSLYRDFDVKCSDV